MRFAQFIINDNCYLQPDNVFYEMNSYLFFKYRVIVIYEKFYFKLWFVFRHCFLKASKTAKFLSNINVVFNLKIIIWLKI